MRSRQRTKKTVCDTQVEQAQRGTITRQMQDIARSEGMDPYELCEEHNCRQAP